MKTCAFYGQALLQSVKTALMSTHHIEIDEATLVLRALEQGSALASHGVPRAVEVIAHDVDHIQGPGCGKQDEERLPHRHQQAYIDSLA